MRLLLIFMFARYRTHLLLGLLAFACAQGWNRWNIHAMLAAPYAKYNVREGRTVTATDDASYLTPVDVFLGDRPDKDAERFHDRADLRAPGYRIWYLLPRLVMGPIPALSVLVILQCLLYACAVMLLWEVFLAHEIRTWLRIGIILLFAVMPTFHGFLFHTISEGVTPSLSLLVLCCALMAERSRSARWLWTGIAIWSLLMVTRPALLWVGFALFPAMRAQWPSTLRMAAVCVLAFVPTGIWWVGNMVKTGDFVGLHPMYRADEPGITRPTHGAFWGLAKSWGARGEEFHPVMESAYRAALVCDTASTYANGYLALAPPGSLTAEQVSDIRTAFWKWQRFNCEQLAPAMASPVGTVPITTRAELDILITLDRVTEDWQTQHSLYYGVRVPMRVLKEITLHSNLNLYLFQEHLRGRPWMEALRWFSAAVHVALLLLVFLAASVRTPPSVRRCALFACLYIGYLAYVQRGVEERYTLPVLFIGVACAAFVLQRFTRPIFVPKHSRS